jgi:hypothetical protein
MNFKSIEFNLPEAKEQTHNFKAKGKPEKKNDFFIFGKTSKQSGFHGVKSPKMIKRSGRVDSPLQFKVEEHEQIRPKSSYIMRKKVWIDNRKKNKTNTKLIDVKKR